MLKNYDKITFYTISTLWFCTQPCFTMLNYITFTPISYTLHCYHYYQHLWIEFLLQICLWWFLHIFSFSVMFTLLLPVSITLPLLQQQQQQQLTSSLQPVCMMLLLNVLPPTLFSVEAADGGVTSDFQHNYLHSFCYSAYCLDSHFTAVSHQYS